MTGFSIDSEGNLKNWDGSDFVQRGDLIISGSSGQVFKVKKCNPKNYACEDMRGNPWNVPRRGAKKAPEGTAWEAPEKPVLDKLVVGQVVVFKNVTSQRKFGYGKFVVIKNLADDRYQVAALNGDANRYVRCGRNSLEVSSAV